MNLSNSIAVICSLLFLTIGLDKFFNFMEPPCSLMDAISPMVWKGLGILQLIGAICILLPKFRRSTAIFFTGFMLFFTCYHILSSTYDIGGSVFIAILLLLLIWNPPFIRTRKISNT